MPEFDDLAVGLARAERKRWLTRSTLILGGAVIALAGFVGGVQVQKAQTPAASTNAAAAAAARAGGAGRQFGGQGTQTGTPTAAATGKIKLVDGSTVYIETADGNVITVKTTGTTSVLSASKIKLADLKAGATVTIQGQTGSDGTVTATTVTAAK